MNLSLEQIKFCAEECARQKSGELSVYHMCHALGSAIVCYTDSPRHLSVAFIGTLGRLVHPENRGFRSVPVSVNYRVIPHEQIYRQLGNLVNAVNDSRLSPEEFYQEFEEIHPFVDGNGRTGAILYNWLRGSLTNPVTPPEFNNSTQQNN